MKKYDFGLNWSGTIQEGFVNLLKAACKDKKLSFLWISDENIKSVLRDLDGKKIAIKTLLDTEATYNKKDDLYARICYLVKDSGGAVINDPDRTKSAVDKSAIHYELINAGIPAPYTVIVRNWQPDTYCLSDEERKKIGIPFVIKPALGYGQLGVIRDARGSILEIAQARNFDRGDNFLLQEKIIPIELGRKRAWFRVFNVFNSIIPCWWDDQRNLYEHVCYEEFNTFGLFPLVKIVSKIAGFTRMAWFSTEVAIDKKNGRMRFLAIDYVNDQCDMGMQMETLSGVPDAVVKYTANHIVDTAHRFIHSKRVSKRYSIRLQDARVELAGLGSAPDLLNPALLQKKTNPDDFRYKVLRLFKESTHNNSKACL
ncbi:MAG: hypothetical protein ISS45_11035 [Candidatus Omnitrophica bacterium]|nr:hypothetical protein [Candidatus Omnitrophota bacterium]